MDSFWAGMGAAAGAFAVLLAWLQYRTGKTGLVAEVSSVEYSVPDHIASGPSRIYDLISRNPVLRSRAGEYSEEREEVLKEFEIEFEKVFPRKLRFTSESLRGYVRIKLFNHGHSTAEAVAVKLSSAVLARITRSGHDSPEQEVSGVVEVGDVRPGEDVLVEVWGRYSSSSKEPKVVQKNGRAKVLHFETVTPFWQSISKNWVLLILVLFWVLLTILIAIPRRVPSASPPERSRTK